ncbi:MAG: HAD-IIA family hydrolase [Pseudodesulfovibrio sp.]|uniref:HAD-superfamily hydrolase, subfamily IIA n=2 Tax=Desulfovibrionaceae TaxID=194924 RepID=E6VYZ7_PSEA9|nr:HAD-superfamily hydrolase, subfamily IIA [Pseudodesulfovibrio aespoeensis Aspo-2]MBU4559081.1 HAD-IIA family hydrolase [Pseudomonadota bacterium]MBV1773624.1 HAD-IIA family hydrolase [Pseudodesulfovibrio sp.]
MLHTFQPLSEMRLFLFDMDGTLHNGAQGITGTVECLKAIADMGAHSCILTNNSSRTRRECQDILAGFGCEVPERNIYTAGIIATHYIASHWPGSSVYVVGNTALEDACREYGLRVTNDSPEPAPETVLVGLDPTLNYEKLATACMCLKAGARYLATHHDMICPVGEGRVVPDIGCTLAYIQAATGLQPLSTGKPNPYVLSVIREDHSVPLERIVMVGDRLTTDIALGVYGSISTALVFSGVTSRTEYDQSPYRTPHVFSHVGELAHALKMADRKEADCA